MLDKKILDKIINAILQVIVPDKIILFGSQARGEAKIDSDYDLLVIKSGISNTLQVEKAIYRSFFQMYELVSVDVLVATPEIVEKYKDAIGSVIKPALEEGVVVYG